MCKPIKLSVRKIVDLLLRCGDIDSRFNDSSAMFMGLMAHRQIQKEAAKECNYKKEVSLKHEMLIEDIPVVLSGRADGVITGENNEITIDEIKSTTLPLDILYKSHEQHLGQGKIYAFMYLQTLDTIPSRLSVQLTYYQLETEELKRHKWDYTIEEIENFFTQTMAQYGVWLKFERDWKIKRDESIKNMDFPYPSYRAGQRELAVATYRTITAQKKLYVSAPTGIGKTLAGLFPTIKAMGEEKVEKIFYLTAKTITRTVAEDAIKLMEEKNLQFKSITLRAKEKICINNEHICNPEFCPQAKGHYNRVNDAILDIINNQNLITPDTTTTYAQKHQVCPHEFALDISLWCDLIIGDYNHVFDPVVYLKRFFNDTNEDKDYTFLIDEAHNLADRVRDMYTASLSKSTFSNLRKQLRDKDNLSKELRKNMRQINAYLSDIKKEHTKSHANQEHDMVFKAFVLLFSNTASEWLKKNDAHELFKDVLTLYFDVSMYLLVAEIYDKHYTTIYDIWRNDITITQFCLDPSNVIANGLSRGKSSIIFSATLTPLNYYRDILGGNNEDACVALPSPFDPNRLLNIACTSISTKYLDRENSYLPIANIIKNVIDHKKGNYFVFFPSYEYMNTVYEIFKMHHPTINTIIQSTTMTEDERLNFLKNFDENNSESLVGFVVLGGIFSEGIDLKGNRLIGSLIVSVGIPKITFRSDLIRDYFNNKNGQGYDYAYVFPGMNKVMQAAGRVIRSETDKGVVVLIDSRYGTAQYRGLFPAHWANINMVRSDKELGAILTIF